MSHNATPGSPKIIGVSHSNAFGRKHLRAVDSQAERSAERAKEDPVARVQKFFDQMLPAVIVRRPDLFNKVSGSLAMFVEGAGCWTIRFGNHASPEALTRDANFESDCVTVFSVSGFVALLDGRTPEQEPVLIGDARLLSKLGHLMVEPGRGQLGVRLAK